MGDPSVSGPSANTDGIRAQLERILASEMLGGSDQLKRLLRWVVERTLNGQSELLKEYHLGLEVFHRPPDYDPKVDPIVRVQARRLRSKLDEYYASEGAHDPIVIDIPRGGYVPVFRGRDAAPAPAPGRSGSRCPLVAAAGVAVVLVLAVALVLIGKDDISASGEIDRGVAVLPLQMFTNDPNRAYIADQVAEVLTTELAKDRRMRVLSRTTASGYRDRGQSLPEIARALRVRWVIEGSVGVEGARVYVKLRSVDATTDRKIWADVFDCELRDLVPANVQAADNIAAAIITELRSRP